MISARAGFVALRAMVGSLVLLSPPALLAAPRDALVIGNATYAASPQLPACLLSAHAMAAALHNLGFDVVEREDASSGGTDAAIGEFARKLTAAPGATAFIYVCGYAMEFNNRLFLLPVSANITRPADVLAQGVLAKSLLDVLARGGAGPSIAAMDLVPGPGGPATIGPDALAQNSLPDALGLIAVSQARPADAPTPLAAALVAGVKGPDVQTAAVLAAVQRELAANKAVTLAALRPPVAPGYLAGGPPPSPAPPPAPGATARSEPAAPSLIALPADEQMTEADRRRVQTALARLGYYDGQVDGVFGPETRAAIRRYQHELAAAMTGRLTAAQATRLASGQ